MSRMFETRTGKQAAAAVGNETRTLAALGRLSVEVVAEALLASGKAGGSDRMLVIPGRDNRPPVLMLMSPGVVDVKNSRLISDDLDLDFAVMQRALAGIADLDPETPEAAAFREVLDVGPEGLAELFLISQPEVVLTRRPKMIPTCVPTPHAVVHSGGQTSTAGVLCHDQDGDFGVTACLHGTGPVGASVRVGSHNSYVKSADAVQDIVFIPLGDEFKQPPLNGLGGVLDDREPARSDQVSFDGATNNNCTTRIFSTDAGLLRIRPNVQLKLQTRPDTDEGDSGSALIDDQDKVLGFAFERTAPDEYPEFTDWIWAANALPALGLVPFELGRP